MILRFQTMGRFLSLGTMMMRDAPQRPGMLTAFVALFISLIVPILLSPAAVHAQLLDPSATVQGVASGWITPAKNVAREIWGSLIVIEFVFFGIQFGLFRQDFTEMFGSMALKIITTGFFLWLIQNADTLLPAVINSFTKSATMLDPNAGGSGLTSLLLQVLASVALIFAGAAVALGVQQGLALISAPFVFGNGFAGQADGMDVANNINILLMQLIAFLMVGAVAVILLQWALTNIESYIVMFAGIIFLGFSGSRWTLPFAQGYMSYAINVGTKLFTLYLILSCESALATNVLGPVAGAAIAIGADPTGVGGPVALGLLIIAAVNVMIMAALAWYIPNIAGSFLSGQSSLSASSMMSMMASAGAGIAMADAQKKQGGISHEQGQKLAGAQQHLQGAGFGQSGAGGGANGSMPAAPPETALAQGAPMAIAAPANGAPATAQSASAPGSTGQSITGSGGIYTAGISSSGGSSGGNGTIGGAYTAGQSPASALLSNGHSTGYAGGAPGSMSPASATPVPISASAAPPRAAAGGTPLSASAAPPSGGASSGAPSGGSADAGADSLPPSQPTYGGGPSAPSAPPTLANGQPNPLAAGAGGSAGSGSAPPPPGYVPMADRSPAQLAATTPVDAKYAVANDSSLARMGSDKYNALPPATQQALQAELTAGRAQSKASEALSEAYALSSLAQALPRGESAPSAIQVRLSSPDKL